MDEGRRSGDPSGFIVKNRSSSGCLVVRKKGNNGNNNGVGIGIGIGGGGGVGSSGSRKFSRSKKDKKRARLDMGDSDSSDELPMPPRRRVGPETIRVCNGLSLFEKSGVCAEESDIVGRKRSRSNEVDDVIGRSCGAEEDFSGMKRNRLDVFEFDEYEGNDVEMMRRRSHFDDDDDDGMDGRGRFLGSMMADRNGVDRDFETGSSRHPVIDRRKGSYFERPSGVSRGDHVDRDESGNHPQAFYRDKHDLNEPIRVQGKNGVLKVMVNKKKSIGGMEVEEKRKGLRPEDTLNRNALIRPPLYSESKIAEKVSSVAGSLKSPLIVARSKGKNFSARKGKVRNQDPEDSDTSLKLGPKKVDSHNSNKVPLSTKNLKEHSEDSEDSDTLLKLGPNSAEARKSGKGTSGGGEITPSNQVQINKDKEGKVKRGTGTAKQKLRERIREMLLNARWTIDYRPRRNRDYLDAVYISPSGTAYWSIIKAYDALVKYSNGDVEELKAKGDPFTPLSDEVLSQLTRKTRKKMEKEMKLKKKQMNLSENEKARGLGARKSSSSRHDEESMDSGSHEEKLCSFIKQGGKSLKSRVNGNISLNLNSKGKGPTHHMNDELEQTTSGTNSHQGRKSRKLGRCTLLARNSNEVLNSENEGFVSYAGKRTLLAWLIDCGTVQLSQKVHYMNRRRTRVMLEGWVTRDGIHCGCCSKILTVSKFEIHAGSKLRQPFQNIYLDSGVSLLDCQIDAWNRQESVEHTGFYSVDVDGDDPNDDTCGICGDGGDLICCDGCPSTYHQSCLGIQMLPPGDWHCPNCTCKFCGIASENIVQKDHTTVSELLTCSLCAKRYHKSCLKEMDALYTDPNNVIPCFCGKTCRELFEQLQKYLGVKHELESGFSWSLIRRMDVNFDMSPQGLPQRVECNSKLAVALSVMDECFLPIMDRRSGINLICNVLYNCGSNFNRLNYSGFYTAILERGDDIISAASIRFHGTQLAEMPFIGTRHIYRRQGMCSRLLSAIESVLCSLRVQKLIIPAVSELTNTWTGVFGFTTLDESLKQELKSMNMLVFPGMDMLQKQLLEKENIDKKKTNSIGLEGSESEDRPCITPEVAAKSDIASLAMHDLNECDGGWEHASGTNDKVVTTNSDPQCTSVDADFVSGNKLDGSATEKKSLCNSDTSNGMHKLDKPNGSATEKKSLCNSDTSNGMHKLDIKTESDSLAEDNMHKLDIKTESVSPAEDNMHKLDIKTESVSPAEDNANSSTESDPYSSNSDPRGLDVSLDDISVNPGSLDDPNEAKDVLSLHRNTFAGLESVDKVAELDFNSKCLINTQVATPVRDDIQVCKEGDVQNAHALNLNVCASDEIKISIKIEEAKSPDCESVGMLVEVAPKGKHLFDPDAGSVAMEIENKPGVDSPIEDKSEYRKEDLETLNAEVACPEAVPSTDGETTDKSSQKKDECIDAAEAVVPFTEDETLSDDISTQKIDEFPSKPEAVPSTDGATDSKYTQ
ncbi:uncharacterized protein LOC126670500 [Mercurialis annua]|uniref:uncharacterized protein LOC126670500 n=1 Tax=Mercurialis annua TaxID=3986 RepID=UPI00215F501F|nr:uncharacterized protein LOC126670500 [Mercurialis annua]